MKKLLLFFWGFAFIAVHGQQDPLYGLYLANPLTINPACTGMNNIFEATAGYRNQWAGFDGNPNTYFVTANTTLGEKIGTGFLMSQDKIGENRNTTVNGSFAYRLKLGMDNTFAFGMQAGLINYKTDPSSITMVDADDPAFSASGSTKFNAGAGALLKNDRYVIGLSVPKMLNNSLHPTGSDFKLHEKHYYLFGSYFFFLSERIVLKPAVLFKGVKGSPFSADINFNVNIDRKYTAGIYTRNMQSYGLLAQIILLDKFRFAYAFEVPTNKSVGAQFTTNELMLCFQLNIFRSQEKSILNGLL